MNTGDKILVLVHTASTYSHLEGGLLQRVPNHLALVQLHQRLAGGHDQVAGLAFPGAHHLLKEKVVRGEGAGLVEAADLDLACVRDPGRGGKEGGLGLLP